MSRIVVRALAVGFGFAVTTGAIALRDSVVSSSRSGDLLGALDVAAYCRKTDGPTALAINIRNDAEGWRCQSKVNGILASSDVEYDRACAVMFGSPARAESSNAAAPYSWRCYRT